MEQQTMKRRGRRPQYEAKQVVYLRRTDKEMVAELAERLDISESGVFRKALRELYAVESATG